MAIALLVVLQFVITWLSVGSSTFNSMIKITPTPLLKDGRMPEAAMKHVRITKDEIRTAARQQGMGGPDKVAAVVLESDGSLSVIPIEKLSSGLALEGVSGA